jgi:hypothetical protein
MAEEPRSLSPDQYRKFQPQNITAQELAELLPFVVAEWNISCKQEYVSKSCIEEIEKFKPHLRRHFSN